MTHKTIPLQTPQLLLDTETVRLTYKLSSGNDVGLIG